MSITNSNFCGAGDDCLNVHGVHFAVTDITENTLHVRFMHSQTHGFLPLSKGDSIEYINPKTLLSEGHACIKEVHALNEYDIALEVDSTEGAQKGMVIEDTSKCPELYFAGNTLTRIITRGLLITTRGKTVVENNRFYNNEMAGILCSDDAKSWYESGPCTHVEIRNNYFGRSGAFNIQILPENGNTGSIVHGDFIIEGNVFDSPENGGIDAHCLKSLVMRNNTCRPEKKEGFVKADHVLNIERD